jgi:hypothetical protein
MKTFWESINQICDHSENVQLKKGHLQNLDFNLKAYVSQEILNWHSLRHSHSAEL